MESNVEDQNTAPAAEETAAPRRRASRRVSAAAGATSEAAVTVTSEPVAAAEPAAPAAEAAAEAPAAEAPAAEAAPKKRATRSRKKVEEAPAEAAAEAPAADAAEAPAADAAAAEAAAEAPAAEAAPKKRATRSRKKVEEAPAEAAAEAPAADAAEAPAAEAAPAAETAPAAEAAPAEAADAEKPSRNRRGRGRGQKNDAETAENGAGETATEGDDAAKGRGQNQAQQQNGERGGQAKNGPAEQGTRSSRTRQRDRKRRGAGDELELEITEDDVLLPIAGILDVLDNYAFVRTSGYLPGTSDVYVSLGQVKKYSLRRGDAVVGAIRQPREGEGGSRQKYNAIVKIDSVNGRSLEENEKRVDVAELTPVYAAQRLRLERAADAPLGRSIDLAAPLGLGQRALVVLPPHADGTAIVTELAASVSATSPDAHLMVVLADAHPEDVTHLERTVRGEVVAATFDRTAEDQATIAELAIERAKRMLELGHDVVVLLDSLNSFARAYAQAQHTQARPAHDELDEFALGQIKKLLAAARNVENGGSLTLLATVHRGTKIAADETLLREARRVANSEIRIKKTRAGLAPAVDLVDSRTSRTAGILSEDEARVLEALRAELHEDDDAEKKLVARLRETDSNAALLAELQRTGKLS
ncbi:transcription termination factor Rho [Leucobacter sp. PH1c]|uniref:transcription termination factor Rho n=1 Tax=Leucobacter sp. PH1c TaxID=1397278 RepID=UPI000468B8C1|nr:transcription termination factor Rho [Leucobacter sp. PH1c]